MPAILKKITDFFSEKEISFIFLSETAVKKARNFVENFERIPEFVKRANYYIVGGDFPFGNVTLIEPDVCRTILDAKGEVVFCFGLNYHLTFDEIETTRQLLSAISRLNDKILVTFILRELLNSRTGLLIRQSHDLVIRLTSQLDGYMLEIVDSVIPGVPSVSIDFIGGKHRHSKL
ncbi:hypothetical protein [Archaeoglobus veneficus]|uniref:hypothetical protein n=1 Tax=Archaeoglobus veneficus TaxID=58290 RepID=UPI00064F7F95|nr:hypothetical protein [Archaeoglobus veneficus]